MSKWKKVIGTMPNEPKALDMTSSPTTVYERKNITKLEVDDRVMWQYDEREIAIEEYEKFQNELCAPAMQTIMQAISNIELSIEMKGVE